MREESETAGLKLNIQKTKIMASGPITSRQIKREIVEVVTDSLFLGSKITADVDCSHEIKRCLLLGRKAMTNLDSILQSRDIILLTNIHIVKGMIFPVVVYEWEKVKVAHWLTLWPHGLYSPWNSLGQNTGVGRDQTQVSHIAGKFFTSWATRKPKNTGVGSLSLFQQIFLTKESNQGLLHCRWILYELSHEGMDERLGP